MSTQTIEVNIQSTGITQEDQLFIATDDTELPSEEQQWQSKQEKNNAVHTQPSVITVSRCYMEDNCTNTMMQRMEQFIKVRGILIEQNAQPVLLNFKKQMLGLPFDEQNLATNPRYIH